MCVRVWVCMCVQIVKKIFELKCKGYRDGWYKKKRDNIGMAYESPHIMELLSVQCLQVDDVIPILSLAVVLIGVVAL